MCIFRLFAFVLFCFFFALLFAGRWSLFAAASLSFVLSCLSFLFSYNGSIGGRLSPQPFPLHCLMFLFCFVLFYFLGGVNKVVQCVAG